MNRIYVNLIGILLIMVGSCSDSDFLSEKPNSGILAPTTLDDVQKLLSNNIIGSISSGLTMMSSDEYVVSQEDWETLPAIERNASIWNPDIYEGAERILDWNRPFSVVFYANSAMMVLDQIESDPRSAEMYNELKGWALFLRAYANYELVRTFCKSFDEGTADTDLGIPIRLLPNIDELQPRSTLRESYTQILNDAEQSAELLRGERTQNFTRPNKIAAFAFLSRVYLDMGDYEKAGYFANSALGMYNVLLDYNTVSATSATPFSSINSELLYSSMTVGLYQLTTVAFAPSMYRINPELMELYDQNDLRRSLFFTAEAPDEYVMKRSYSGMGVYGFTGLATDELYLIRAECLAREGKPEEALSLVHTLLNKRYVEGTVPTVDDLSSSGKNALEIVLEERRKELVWRSLRLQDIKRYNRDGAGITLHRHVGNRTFTLAPGDPRYVMPIPEDEIVHSKLIQNQR